MYEFTDEWGFHSHTTLPAPPFDPKYSLPKNFWDGYERSWNKE